MSHARGAPFHPQTQGKIEGIAMASGISASNVDRRSASRASIATR
jgi:hypothetical protein